MTLIHSDDPEHIWRRREATRTVLCGVLSFVLTVSVLTFGNQQLTGWLVHFGIRDREQEAFVPEARSAVEPPIRYQIQKLEKKVSKQLPASVLEEKEEFPPFDRAVHPVSKVPNWGAMRTSAEWNRSYGDLRASDFVPVPAYNLDVLTIPVKELLKDRERNTAILTAKLYYSTRFFGNYSLDAGEFTGSHAGIDLKLAMDTPVGAIGGGRVYDVRQNANLGLHVIIEHRIPGQNTVYSTYGHLGKAFVTAGQDVSPGTIVGLIGMTGKTTAPHLHLAMNRSVPTTVDHGMHGSAEDIVADAVHPVQFIAEHASPVTQLVEDTQQNRPVEVTGRLEEIFNRVRGS